MDWTTARYALHKDAHPDGTPLTDAERAHFARLYLSSPPPTPNRSQTPSPHSSEHRKRRRANMMDSIQRLLRHPVHVVLHWAIHVIMSIYIRLRRWYHEVVGRVVAVLRYHHRSPEIVRRDVRGLAKLPRHLSVLLELQWGMGGGGGGGVGVGAGEIRRRGGLGRRGRRRSTGAGEMALEKLGNDVAEIAAWCACVGIETLSVYERSGILKSYIPHLHTTISRTLHAYFGHPPQTPTFHLRAPHLPSYSPPSSPPSPSFTPLTNGTAQARRPTLNILLLSSTDGRPTLVDLTKTLTEMAQRGKLNPYGDISEELIDAEMREIVMEEPDLLILFGSGGREGGGGADGAELVLQGYPPWQLRLTELFHVQDNTDVGYQVFLRALHRYARAQMRFGR